MEGGAAVGNAKFIVFEGIDGSGKSTQRERLVAALSARGRRVMTTAEPTDGEWGRALRRFLSGKEPRTVAEQAALVVLDRIEHNKAIRAALEEGADVISDRYYYSTLAYQGSACDFGWVRDMNCRCPEIRRPDLCIFLDLTPDAALARIDARGEAREVFETREKLERVRNTFLGVFSELDDNVAVIDASGTPDEVAARVLDAVEKIL